MNNKLIDQIRSAEQSKIDTIKEIITHHPGYGTKKGYSWYTGGFVDNGDWKIDVLLATRDLDLNTFLDFLKNEDLKAQQQRDKLDRISKLSEEEQRAYREEEQKKQREMLKEMYEKKQLAMLWGRKKDA